jgi:hypothetical protein
LAEHWDLPSTGIFYSKDVASGHGANFKQQQNGKSQLLANVLQYVTHNKGVVKKQLKSVENCVTILMRPRRLRPCYKAANIFKTDKNDIMDRGMLFMNLYN